MNPGASHVVMGRVGAPWGIKGWVKLFSFAEPASNLIEYQSFWIKGLDGLQKLEFDEMKAHGQDFVGHIKGCDSRETAGRFTGQDLMVEKSILPVLKEGYYWHQLEGLRVQTTSGQDLGTVQYLMETGANDVVIVKGDASSIDRQERLLPWLPERVVKQVDIANRVLVVDWDKDY